MTAALGVALLVLIAATSLGIRIFDHIAQPDLGDLPPGLEALQKRIE